MTCPHCGSGFDSKDKEAITYCSDFCHDKVFIPRTSLPKLPEGWKPAISDATRPVCKRMFEIFSETKTMTRGEYAFLLELLNTCYPSPVKEDGQCIQRHS